MMPLPPAFAGGTTFLLVLFKVEGWMPRTGYLFLFVFLYVSSYALAGDLPVWWQQVENEAERDGYSLVTPDDLKKLYASEESFLVVDAREDYEYKEGHLPKAVNFEIDLGDRIKPKPEKQSSFLKLLGNDKNRKIIIYCRNFR